MSNISANTAERGGLALSFSQGAAQRAFDQTHQLESRASFEQAKAEEKKAALELVQAMRVEEEA